MLDVCSSQGCAVLFKFWGWSWKAQQLRTCLLVALDNEMWVSKSVHIVSMACCLFDAKPLSEPMLAYCQYMNMNKFQKKLNWNRTIFIQENTFENIVCKMAEQFSYKKIHLRIFYAKWRPLCLCVSMFMTHQIVECHYNVVEFNMVLHTSLQEVRQNINQRLNPQKTLHTSPWRASYGVSFVNILEKIDRRYNGTTL